MLTHVVHDLVLALLVAGGRFTDSADDLADVASMYQSWWSQLRATPKKLWENKCCSIRT